MKQLDLDTPDRLLTAAESLLLESGYDRVSVRAVCAAANANSAAVHYHFGSKESLVAALLESRLGPVWAGALAGLEGRDAGVPEIVGAVVDPLVALAADPAGRLHLNLLARLVLARRDVAWAARWFSLDPWVVLLRQRIPNLPVREAEVRWMLSFDLILGQFGDPLAGDRVLSPRAVATLRAFVAAGLSAPMEST